MIIRTDTGLLGLRLIGPASWRRRGPCAAVCGKSAPRFPKVRSHDCPQHRWITRPFAFVFVRPSRRRPATYRRPPGHRGHPAAV